MSILLPPMRLVGARILRGGALVQRTVAIAGGRITRGPLPAIELEGLLVLPGIVDIAGTTLAAGSERAGVAAALDDAARTAARAGVTTDFVQQGWSWVGGSAAPDRAERVMAALSACRGRAGVDQRAQLVIDPLTVAEGARLEAALARWGVGGAIFEDGMEPLRLAEQAGAAAFAAAAAARGVTPGMLSAAMAGAEPRRREVPRHLCRLAEAMDAQGVVYGSRADADGQVREHYSMIGARLALQPAAHAAGAAARAMGDPVVLAARDLLGKAQPGACAWTMLYAGICTALLSDGAPETLATAAFALAERDGMDLARAWAMISARPAELMRLPDRGTLDQGMRADLVVVDHRARRIEATVAGGALVWVSDRLAPRFAALAPTEAMAAE